MQRKKKFLRRRLMSKILFISNETNRITSFATASIAASHALGMDFYQVANWHDTDPEFISSEEKKYGIRINNFCISRNPFAKCNLTAYKEIVDLIKKEKIDYIHCNTPTGGLLGRLAGKECKVKKVIYQAHGFHFYQGAPKKNWLMYYPIEKRLARYTDALITINSEDYTLAKNKFKLRNNGKVYYVPGVGIDVEEFKKIEADNEDKRAEFGLKDSDFICISAGDLVARKNYETAIRAIEKVADKNVHYLICGIGPEEESLRKLSVEKGVENRVHFLGYRKDVRELMKISDLFLFTSHQEGLPRSTMEAMASGLPCVVSKIRGNVDLVDEGKGGFLLAPTDADGFASAIEKLYGSQAMQNEMRGYNLEKIKEFDSSVVEEEIKNIYRNTLQTR